MTVDPVSGQTPVSAGPAPPHTKVARWSVGLAEAAVAVTAVAAYCVAYAVGGSSAVEDNWVAILVTTSFFAGVVASAVAFVLVVAVKVNHERWTLLWSSLAMPPEDGGLAAR
ncbi:MAG TPA: hypothetical protein VES02_06230 [Dermatophilaceae bacterium]|nr:hypothetical protein [Dermatophilaceae bacterium]